jgi:hypothetical protein
MRGLPVGLVDVLDPGLVEHVRSWAALRPVVDLVLGTVL